MWQRNLQEEFDVFYKIHHCSVGEVRRPLAEQSWTQLSLTPGFLPHKTCSSESSCLSRPGCPVLGILHSASSRRIQQRHLTKKLHCTVSHTIWAQKNHLYAKREIWGGAQVPLQVLGGWTEEMDALRSVLLSRKLDSSDASCTRQQYQGSARLSDLKT